MKWSPFPFFVPIDQQFSVNMRGAKLESRIDELDAITGMGVGRLVANCFKIENIDDEYDLAPYLAEALSVSRLTIKFFSRFESYLTHLQEIENFPTGSQVQKIASSIHDGEHVFSFRNKITRPRDRKYTEEYNSIGGSISKLSDFMFVKFDLEFLFVVGEEIIDWSCEKLLSGFEVSLFIDAPKMRAQFTNRMGSIFDANKFLHYAGNNIVDLRGHKRTVNI